MKNTDIAINKANTRPKFPSAFDVLERISAFEALIYFETILYKNLKLDAASKKTVIPKDEITAIFRDKKENGSKSKKTNELA